MIKFTAFIAFCVGLTFLTTQAEAQHKIHSGVGQTQRKFEPSSTAVSTVSLNASTSSGVGSAAAQ
jgi:hypothetical protein